MELEQIKEKWNDILLNIMNDYDFSEISINTWLKPLEIHSLNEGFLQLIVPEDKEAGISIINKKFLLPLQVTIAELTGITCEIELLLPNQVIKEELPVQKKNIPHSEQSNLKNKYTFNTFVEGANNRFAFNASLAVAEAPGIVYNPLFLYGGVGLGKTHLMRAIEHFILERNPNSKVLYVTSEEFTNEVIEAMRNKVNPVAMAEFREKYRNIDVLLVDDVQFIIGKESTQEEFFHTFNTLRENKKQIVISSDRPPKEFKTLEERLRTRFEWGLIADISSPDYETRMAILRKKEEMDGYNIDNEVIEYIATNVKSNIRELEGALNKLIALSNLEKREINLALAEDALKDIIYPDAPKEITSELIIKTVCEHFNISLDEIKSTSRRTELVLPRHIAMYLCRTMTNDSQKSISRLFNKNDHTTVINAVNKITDIMSKDETTKNTIETIKKKISPA